MKLNRKKKTALTLNMTSLIDVLFILLLFFIVTSTFRDPNSSALDLELPKASKTQSEEIPKEETVYLDKNNRVSILGRILPLDSLAEIFPTLKDQLKSKVIVLKGDENVKYQSFITIFDVFKANQIDKLVLASEKK